MSDDTLHQLEFADGSAAFGHGVPDRNKIGKGHWIVLWPRGGDSDDICNPERWDNCRAAEWVKANNLPWNFTNKSAAVTI